MRRRQFEQQLRDLLKAPVEGWSDAEKAAAATRHIDSLLSDRAIDCFTVRFEPFVPGRRPDDEAAYPGLGSSEQVGLFNPSRSPSDHVKLLVRCYSEGRLVPDMPRSATVTATIEEIDDAGLTLRAVHGWSRRDVTARLAPVGGQIDRSEVSGTPRALALDLGVNEVFGPPDRDPIESHFGFGSLFHQRFRVMIDVEVDGARVAGDELVVDVYDETRFGSLYQRLLDVLLTHDTGRQTRGAGSVSDVPISSHPWFPVLCIGMQKSRLYMESIAADLVDQKRALTDPGWLLRVGLYLEFLTCLGIAEAVRDSVEILTPMERHEFEHATEHAEIRARINVDAWRSVWRFREISFGRKGTVGAANLLRKRNAIFAFLRVHHEDLKHAIQLAGPNLHNAQETWHRVFRDAERAVLQMNRDAFPELLELPSVAREFALWHESGSLAGVRLVPRQLTELFGDQDGVFPSACRQYRASMNHVASWALANDLMEYTGDDCIPPSASLLEAHISHRPSLLARLQWRDGFAGSLEVRHEAQEPLVVDRATVLHRLQHVAVLSALTIDELRSLVEGVRPIALGHLERIIIQGREGSSLFILHDGALEVIARNGANDRQLAMLSPPAVVGELAFLLDEPRSATVRALEQAVVLEVCAAHLRPFVEARPALLDALTALLDQRRRMNSAPPISAAGLRDRVRRAIFAG
jgi:CRP-like cAMP-binding protein